MAEAVVAFLRSEGLEDGPNPIPESGIDIVHELPNPYDRQKLGNSPVVLRSAPGDDPRYIDHGK